ncbi:hypothetical protein TNCV_117391 [Trichonephila clavipes]|nr:hypothetical protein TNCV_117391 [Trichonephila clavipes]
MTAVHRTTYDSNTCGLQSRVCEAMDALRTFHSAANGVNGHRMISNRLIMFVMWLHYLSLSCAQSACHDRQRRNDVGVIGPVCLSFPPASSDNRSTSQLLGLIHNTE